jgi:chemotaxis protein CheC
VIYVLDIESLDEIEVDALKELANIGTAHAANSLSQLIGEYIEMSVPEVSIVEVSKIHEKFGEEIVAGVLTSLQDLEGRHSGYLYTIFPLHSSKRLIKTLCDSEKIDDMAVSALMEVGNILSSSFCDASAELLNILLLPSPPNFAMDMAAAVVEAVVSLFAEKSDYIILFETKLGDDDDLNVFMVLIPDVGLFEYLLNMLRGLE